jgi:hypothetical protein
MQPRFAVLRSFMLLRDRENRYHATSAHPTAPEHHPCRRLCSGCAICLAEPVSMLCRPCNHLIACSGCARRAPAVRGRPAQCRQGGARLLLSSVLLIHLRRTPDARLLGMALRAERLQLTDGAEALRPRLDVIELIPALVE